MNEFGVTTLATGDIRFINMAIFLARSLRRTNPKLTLAVVTDSSDLRLSSYFDIVVPFNESVPAGFIHKLYLYDYSPFDETLFIDSDSLVLRPLDSYINKIKVSHVSVQGFKFTDRIWAGVHPKNIKDKTGADYMIMFNGGIYYFKKSNIASKVFQTAKELLLRYDDLGYYKERNRLADEPIMSTAMSMHGMNAFDDECSGMRTLIDISSALKIDILKGECEFLEFNGTQRRKVNPAIIHFSGAHANWFHYKRETAKLTFSERLKWLPDSLISEVINALYNPPYTLFTICYRTIKFILGRERFKIFPLMPTLRYK
ncbi:MAG: hypothetical protein ACJASM_001673 [Salibacteraceae bacterium]|jgi:hypothetical protein